MTATATETLVDVTWDGLPLMALSDELDCIVSLVEGWYDTPAVNGHNVDRDLADGLLYGPKVFGGRTITVTGTAIGERAPLIGFRDAIAQRVANNLATDLVIGDPWLGIALTALVRADGDAYKHTFKAGHRAFTYQLVLLAADHRRYGTEWKQAELSPIAEGVTGREYNRTYPWHYASGVLGDTALLVNDGDLPAPVYATYRGGPGGDLVGPRLTDGHDTIILSTVGDGVTITVNSQTLVAVAPGGASRSQWVMPGSAPMTVPPKGSALWRLDTTGEGTVTLTWRDTYL